MKLEEHCQRSEILSGVRFEFIHRWLDEHASKLTHSEIYKHRKYRHHKKRVDESREKLGELAALVAEDHIRCDCKGELPSKCDYNIPEYED